MRTRLFGTRVIYPKQNIENDLSIAKVDFPSAGHLNNNECVVLLRPTGRQCFM